MLKHEIKKLTSKGESVSNRSTLYKGFVRVEKDEATGHEVVVVTDSVAVFVYDKNSRQVLLISQAREPMVGPDNPEGVITEVVAGRFDKEIGIKALAIQELREEAGLEITEDNVQILNEGVPLSLSPGILTERTYIVFVELGLDSEDTKETDQIFGAEDEGESIKRRFIPVADLLNMTFDNIKTWALTQWFLNLLWSRGEHPVQMS